MYIKSNKFAYTFSNDYLSFEGVELFEMVVSISAFVSHLVCSPWIGIIRKHSQPACTSKSLISLLYENNSLPFLNILGIGQKK